VDTVLLLQWDAWSMERCVKTCVRHANGKISCGDAGMRVSVSDRADTGGPTEVG
jgi:hypothetical protein